MPNMSSVRKQNTDSWLNCPNLFIITVGYINVPVTSCMMPHIICTPRAYFNPFLMYSVIQN